MKTRNLLKLALSSVVTVSMVACNSNFNSVPVNTAEKVTTNKEQKAILKINLAEIFNLQKQGFSVKRYPFSDSEADSIKVSVFPTDPTGTVVPPIKAESEKVFNISEGLSNVFLTLQTGQNKVVVIETRSKEVDVNTVPINPDNKIVLARLMATVKLNNGVNTTLKINYGTYPTAQIIKQLMEDGTASNRALASTIDLVQLDTLINSLTGYNINTNTFGGINPAYIDINAIKAKLIANNNAGVVPLVPIYSKVPAIVPAIDTEIKGKVRVSVKNVAGATLTNAKITINDLTSTNVSNSVDPITVIENVSMGNSLLRVYVNDPVTSKALYVEKIINVVNGATDIDLTGLNSLVAVVPTVKSIVFENINDNKNLPLSNGGSIALSINTSQTLKAKVFMSDGTTNNNVTWTSSDSTKASVSSGTISALLATLPAPVITVTSVDLPLTSITVTVNVTAVATAGDGPTITSFNPVSASTDTLVTIVGTNFDNTSLTTLTAGAASGATNVTVNSLAGLTSTTTLAGAAAGPVAGPPAVAGATSISLNNAAGVNVGSRLILNGQTLTVTSLSGNTVNFTPALTAPGAVNNVVTVHSNINLNGQSLFITSIAGNTVNFTPALAGAAVIGDTVSTSGVMFNGIAGKITDITKTEIKVKVSAGASTGKISVTTPKGTIVSNSFFIVDNSASGGGAAPKDMIFIPTNEFNMGYIGASSDDFYPKHKVILNSFFIDRTEVTNAQYLAFAGLSVPRFINDIRFNPDKQPVVGISWLDATKYCNARSFAEGLANAYDINGNLLDGVTGAITSDLSKVKGYRLPTEAEWEYAARGTDERIYPWGGDTPGESNKKANGFFGTNGAGDGFQYTAPVGSFSNDDSPFGVKDMSGNAYEWVNDWYSSDYYNISPPKNPFGPSLGGSKVIRGGSWYNHPIFGNDITKLSNSMNTYNRLYSIPDNKSNYIGFRTVISK